MTINPEIPLPPQKIWEAFLAGFEEAVRAKGDRLGEFWHRSSAERTAGYHGVYEALVDSLKVRLQIDLLHRREFLHFDCVYFQKYPSTLETPFIYVESENASPTSSHEIAKLLAVAAPLKVLITWAQWDRTRFLDSRSQAQLREKWQSTAHGHLSALRRYGQEPRGLIGFLVGECCEEEILRFHHFSLEERTGAMSESRELKIGAAPRADHPALVPAHPSAP